MKRAPLLTLAALAFAAAAAPGARADVIVNYTTGYDADGNVLYNPAGDSAHVAPDAVVPGASAGLFQSLNGGFTNEGFAATERFSGPGEDLYPFFVVTPDTGDTITVSDLSLLSHTNGGNAAGGNYLPTIDVQLRAMNALGTTVLGDFTTSGGDLAFKDVNASGYTFGSATTFAFYNMSGYTGTDYIAYQNVTLNGVLTTPEPATMALLAAGGLAAAIRRRRAAK
jgi:hypothetical protein